MKPHYATFYTYSINETLKGIFQTLLREMSNDLSTGMLKTEQRQNKDNEIKGTISWGPTASTITRLEGAKMTI